MKKGNLSEQDLRNKYLPKALVNFKDMHHAFPMHSMGNTLITKVHLGDAIAELSRVIWLSIKISETVTDAL